MRLIDAEKLAEVLNRYLEAPHVQLRNCDISVGLRMGINTCLTFLNNANTIEAEPVRHGRWVPFHSEAAGDIQYCSACEIGFDAKMAYCPHCGAKMDGWMDGGDENG